MVPMQNHYQLIVNVKIAVSGILHGHWHIVTRLIFVMFQVKL